MARSFGIRVVARVLRLERLPCRETTARVSAVEYHGHSVALSQHALRFAFSKRFVILAVITIDSLCSNITLRMLLDDSQKHLGVVLMVLYSTVKIMPIHNIRNQLRQTPRTSWAL